MKKASLGIKRKMSAALCAILALAVMAQSAPPYYNRAHALQFPEEDESENTVSGEILDDCFGEVVIYRWQKLTANNYPNDREWHPTMFFWGHAYQLSMNAVFPNDVYLDKSHTTISGAHVFGRDGLGEYPLNNKNVDTDGAAAIPAKYAANDAELKNGVGRNVFYTTGDKNCSYILYEGIEANSKKPYYQVRLSNGKAGTSSAVVGAVGTGMLNLLNGKDKTTPSTGQLSGKLVISQNTPASGGEPLIFDVQSNGECLIYDRNEDDNDVYLVIKNNWFLGESKFEGAGGILQNQYDADDETALIYFGERYRYSAVKDDVTIGSGQILSISPSQYVDTGDNVQNQNGVILQNGKTITINKGGILSISGEFINNGTIINNGGTILIKKNGTIYPFRTGSVPSVNGCGTIKCLGGDIIIKNGGTLYAGLNDESGNIVPFYLDDGSTLINKGLLVYGSMRMGEGARMECYGTSKTYGSWYTAINLGAWDATNGLLPEKRKVIYNSKSFATKQAAIDSLTKLGYSVAVSAESADKTYCDLYFYWPQGIPQDDMLTKCTSSFQKGETSKVPKTILPAIKYYGDGSKSSVNMLGFGLWVPADVSKEKLPHVLKGSGAVLEDFYIDHSITVGDLTI